MGNVKFTDAGFFHNLPAEGGFGARWKKYTAEDYVTYFW